jgi:hypothetical protein
LPFTLAHPALILPFRLLKRWRLSTCGLVAGSLVPDAANIFYPVAENRFGHQLAGIFLLDLPLALAFIFLFDRYARDLLISQQPAFLYQRLAQYRKVRIDFQTNWKIIVLSILIGILTHIFWDSFTHEHGYFTTRIPFLQSVVPYEQRLFTMHNILHLFFSATGLIIVIASVFFLRRDRTAVNPIRSRLPILIFLLLVPFFFLGAVMIFTTPRMREIYPLYIGRFAYLFFSSCFYSLVAVLLLNGTGIFRSRNAR